MEAEKKRRGGPGRGQGRKAKDGKSGMTRTTVHLTDAQRTKLNLLGGSVWMREMIDKAHTYCPPKPQTPEPTLKPEPKYLPGPDDPF